MKISFPNNATTYTPGQTQRVTVTITDPNARRWGFEVSPRLASAASTKSAGQLATSDNTTQLLSSGDRQWITHTSGGTRPGTTGSITFEFDWTAPATDLGDVTFYVAANAANGNGQPTGDLIYTTQGKLTAAAGNPGSPKPAISQNGVVNGASFQPGIAAGSWVTIQGSNFATNTRTWDSDREIVNGVLPSSLDGTSVTINGKPASVYFISPTQINVQAPDDTATGPVNVVVTTGGVASDPITANLQQFSPALFLFDPQSRKYPAAVAADGTFLGPTGLFGTALTTRPARRGETILLFGTGFGPTTTPVTSGRVFSGAAPTSNPVKVLIGGVEAQVAFSGITGAGLYQFNVVIPNNVGTGDQPLSLSVNGQNTPTGVSLAIAAN